MDAVAVGVVAAAVGLALYAYAGYPAVLVVWRALRRRPVEPAEPAEWPMISITVPAYNEERAIGPTLDALLAADYPADRRQILVVSDASSDRTDEIVRGYAGRGVELHRTASRGGKTAAENAARPLLRGGIVVNTDASVRIRPDGLKPLVRALLDPAVGLASGRDVSVTRMEGSLNLGESGYVGYEMWVRALETAVGSIVGASGCFYAIRRELHMAAVPDALSRDFAAALVTREHGLRAVSAQDAVCFVPRIASIRREYRRKVRTMTRGLETLWFKRGLLNPARHGRFAWMLASHKLARWLVPWELVALAAALAALAPARPWATVLLALGVALLLLAAVGWWWPEAKPVPRAVAMATYFVAGNVAGLHAWLNAVRGERHPIWEPTRREEPAAPA